MTGSENMTQTFNILVIAMKKETERRERIANNLQELGLHFRFLDGVDLNVDGEQTPESLGYQPDKALQALRRQLTRAEIGCFASHREAWRCAAKSNKPTLILESDARLSQTSIQVLRALCTDPASSWEMVMLNYHKCLPSLWQRHRIDDTHTLVKFANRRAYCLASYLLSPAGGDKLSAHSRMFYLTADDFTSGSWIDKDIDLYAVIPPCAGLTKLAEESTIDDERQKAHNRPVHKKKNNQAPLRRLELAIRNLSKALRPPAKGL